MYITYYQGKIKSIYKIIIVSIHIYDLGFAILLTEEEEEEEEVRI